MNTTTTRPTEVYFRTDKNGKARAYRISLRQFRTFPLGADAARMMVATGEAVEVNGPSEGVTMFCGSYHRAVRN